MKTWLDEDGNIVYQHYKASKQVISVSECVQRMVNTKGFQYLAMSTDFNAHLITSRLPSEECKSKVLLNLEDVFPNYEAIHSYGGPEEIQTKLELVSVK